MRAKRSMVEGASLRGGAEARRRASDPPFGTDPLPRNNELASPSRQRPAYCHARPCAEHPRPYTFGCCDLLGCPKWI